MNGKRDSRMRGGGRRPGRMGGPFAAGQGGAAESLLDAGFVLGGGRGMGGCGGRKMGGGRRRPRGYGETRLLRQPELGKRRLPQEPKQVLGITNNIHDVAVIDRTLCTGCGDCVEICTTGAITVDIGNASVDVEKCVGCGACVNECPAGAIILQQ